jgi:signal peptidase I
VIRRLLIAIAVLVGAVAVVMVLLDAIGWLHAYRVPASSMEPTLRCAQPGVGCSAKHDDRFIAFGYHVISPARGDIVAVKVPPAALTRCGAGGTYVKRIVGLPGERIGERRGVVYVDGRRLSEPYVEPQRADTRSWGPVRVQPGQYFLMGDNRDSSCDSREWGTVSRSRLIGKLVLVYWPPSRVRLG